MPSIDLVDETFLVAAPEAVAAVVHDPARWAGWWPDLQVTVFMDRGLQGVRWSITGALSGSCEIWLEAFGDGVLLHYFLRGEQASGRASRSAHALARARARRALDWKTHVWALKDELEGGRRPGENRLSGVKDAPGAVESG